jgi:hypothetical protein
MRRNFCDVAVIDHCCQSLGVFFSKGLLILDGSASFALCLKVESAVKGDYALIAARSG